MSDLETKNVEEILLRLGEFGALVTKSLQQVAGDAELARNASVVLLCRLDRFGPLRPAEIVDYEDMTSGGVSKLIDRMEEAGLVTRRRGEVSGDNRAVMVAITPSGTRLLQRLSRELASFQTEIEVLVKDLERLLPG